MKTLACSFFLLLATAANCAAQGGDLMAHEFIRKDVYDAATKAMRETHDYAKLMGSLKNVPGQGYFNPDWTTGSVVLKAGATPVARAIRYNLAGQVIEVRASAEDDSVQLLSPVQLSRFTLGPPKQPSSHFFEVHTYQNSLQSGGRDFFEVLNSEGELQFFLLHKIGIQPGAAQSSTGEYRADAFTKETHLYLQRPGQPKLVEFMVSPKNVVKLFSGRAPEVQAYAATKSWSYTNPQHVVWMTDYYNQLVTAKK